MGVTILGSKGHSMGAESNVDIVEVYPRNTEDDRE